ncbi:U3 snoRNP protein [Cavenderia fasciculata]|uniref:U3 snoRNP protein n=1 Tax=Cavenderia fasciculata TaxID=261658 RepID=F4QED9_CACFS|nr:U3 snoRNP protein [Cavenderia fasciculata]EGG14086.1 U3 snoRNP protein [Cavenderia fasciculata]|eukprot:XP_004350794.1 U3 snoRNP protein [Cavenderia fasciculata]
MDRVNKHLASLEDATMELVTEGYFTKQQYRSIMDKRKDFEVKLTGNSVVKKALTMKYIKYELQLDADLHVAYQAKQKKFGREIHYIKSLRSPLKHALDLFHKLCEKSNDERLWLSYLNIRIARASHAGTSTILSKALQKLPLSPALWRTAAAFEFEVNSRIASARNLIQLGIQYNPSDRSLWHYFFQMELSYVSQLINNININESQKKVKIEILKKKQEKMDIDVKKQKDDSDDDKEQLEDEEEVGENGETVSKKPTSDLLAEQLAKGGENRFITFGKEMFEADTLLNSSVIQGKIAIIIYQAATKKISNDFKFRQEFHKITRKFSEVGKRNKETMELTMTLEKNVTEAILKSLQEDFSANQIEMWMMIASIELGEGSNTESSSSSSSLEESRLKKMLQVLNNGFKNIATEKYVAQVETILMENVFDKLNVGNEQDWPLIQMAKEYLLSLYEQANKQGVLGEQGISSLVQLYINTNQIEKAIKLAESSVVKLPTSIILWTLRNNLLNKQSLLNGGESLDMVTLYEEGFSKLFPVAISTISTQSITAQQFKLYEKYAIQYFDSKLNQTNLKTDSKKTLELFKKLMRSLNGLKDIQNAVKLYFIDYLYMNNVDNNQWQEAYSLVLQFRPISREFYLRTILYIQERQNVDPNQVRSVYETYFQNKDFAASDTETWINYFRFELRVTKDIAKANIIASRAKKSLSSPLAFINSTQ